MMIKITESYVALRSVYKTPVDMFIFYTGCRQLGGLLRERGEVVCPLEADHDKVGSVVPRGVEGRVLRTGARRAWGV